MDNRHTKRISQKLFICGSEDHLIAKYQNSLKDNEKRRKQVRLHERGNCACDNGENNSAQKIYTYMARMSGNDKCPSEHFGDSLHLTNCILDSGETCYMTPEALDFIPG